MQLFKPLYLKINFTASAICSTADELIVMGAREDAIDRGAPCERYGLENKKWKALCEMDFSFFATRTARSIVVWLPIARRLFIRLIFQEKMSNGFYKKAFFPTFPLSPSQVTRQEEVRSPQSRLN
ncbi:hypothetical protein [Tychonema sp. LEGE 07203]|uniref:hypothetical protein n=1 Tax=Tychonema sp. LEGE 07203 TaxID=1828671 RepID=UPI001881515B|nr:hypothetical protein [Tychonema sp. LEGE 07203]MBE9093145.1 hypothetical protein [Tychonema sp. LEGE 07203]